jgi:hypothetical protein
MGAGSAFADRLARGRQGDHGALRDFELVPARRPFSAQRPLAAEAVFPMRVLAPSPALP